MMMVTMMIVAVVMMVVAVVRHERKAISKAQRLASGFALLRQVADEGSD